eukprot:12122190-Alexandrium_andersonii.AAC.1
MPDGPPADDSGGPAAMPHCEDRGRNFRAPLFPQTRVGQEQTCKSARARAFRTAAEAIGDSLIRGSTVEHRPEPRHP